MPPDQTGRTSQGWVNKIISQSFVDGPGNRVVIFLQGCNLRCQFCHNPQTLARCNSCGACVSRCPAGALSISGNQVIWDNTKCQDCDTCIHVCPYYSSPKVKITTPEALWAEIEPFSIYLRGVTVTGGEPTLQINFLEHFLSMVKTCSSLTTLVETNGSASRSSLARILPYLDMAMIDLKVFDPAAHRKLTGKDNSRIKENIRFLASYGKVYSIRLTVIPGRSDSLENAVETARFIAAIDPGIRLRFLRFRPHGTRGEAENWPSPTAEYLDRLVEVARNEGLTDVSHSL